MKIRILFTGIASRSLFFIEQAAKRDDCEIVALCDKYPSRAKFAAEHYGLQNVAIFNNFPKCLRNVECDAIMIFTPDFAHAEIAVPALNAGKYVFVEKPLDTTERKCLSIIEADEAAGGKAYVGFNLRHAPLYKKIKELLDTEIAGRILTIQCDEFYDGGRTYFRRWNRFVKFGGGLWITKATHDFDIIQWMTGEKPETVSAFSALTHYVSRKDAPSYCAECKMEEKCPDAFNKQGYMCWEKDFLRCAVSEGMPRPDLCLYNSEKDTFDHGICLIKFKNDIIATYTVNVVSGFTNRRIRVSGTKAAIDGDLAKQELTIRYRDPSKTEKFTVCDKSDGHGGADSSVLPDFLDFVKGLRKPRVTPREALTSVLIGLAARKSCDKNKTCRINL